MCREVTRTSGAGSVLFITDKVLIVLKQRHNLAVISLNCKKTSEMHFIFYVIILNETKVNPTKTSSYCASEMTCVFYLMFIVITKQESMYCSNETVRTPYPGYIILYDIIIK